MVAIICTSPFHIFTAFILKHNEFMDKDVEIIMLDYSRDSEMLYKKLKKCKEFSSVHYLHANEIWKKYALVGNYFYKVNFLNSGIKIVERENIKWRDIEVLLFPYHEPFAVVLARNLNINRIKCQYAYYDDGAAAYVDSSNVIVKHPSRIEKMLCVPNQMFKPDVAYMYGPENTDLNGYISIKKINIPRDYSFLDRINAFFDYSSFERRKFIFFDQCSDQNETEKDKAEKEKSLKILDEYFDRKDVYIKKHPKRCSNDFEDAGWDIMPVSQYVPFELCILNDPGISDCVLISDFSSASITPKLLFNTEPNLIFLNRLLCYFSENNNIKDVINVLRKLYSYDGVFEPKNDEELRKILENIKYNRRINSGD